MPPDGPPDGEAMHSALETDPRLGRRGLISAETRADLGGTKALTYQPENPRNNDLLACLVGTPIAQEGAKDGTKGGNGPAKAFELSP
jgi:hypothetical protein